MNTAVEFNTHVEKKDIKELINIILKLEHVYMYIFGDIVPFYEVNVSIFNDILVCGKEAVNIEDINVADIFTNLSSDNYALFDIQLFVNKKNSGITISIPYGFKEQFNKWIEASA